MEERPTWSPSTLCLSLQWHQLRGESREQQEEVEVELEVVEEEVVARWERCRVKRRRRRTVAAVARTTRRVVRDWERLVSGYRSVLWSSSCVV